MEAHDVHELALRVAELTTTVQALDASVMRDRKRRWGIVAIGVTVALAVAGWGVTLAGNAVAAARMTDRTLERVVTIVEANEKRLSAIEVAGSRPLAESLQRVSVALESLTAASRDVETRLRALERYHR